MLSAWLQLRHMLLPVVSYKLSQLDLVHVLDLPKYRISCLNEALDAVILPHNGRASLQSAGASELLKTCCV